MRCPELNAVEIVSVFWDIASPHSSRKHNENPVTCISFSLISQCREKGSNCMIGLVAVVAPLESVGSSSQCNQFLIHSNVMCKSHQLWEHTKSK